MPMPNSIYPGQKKKPSKKSKKSKNRKVMMDEKMKKKMGRSF